MRDLALLLFINNHSKMESLPAFGNSFEKKKNYFIFKTKPIIRYANDDLV